MTPEINRTYNLSNPYQGNYKKVLTICTAGLLRSPTAAVVLASQPFCFNTRSVGIDDPIALTKVDNFLLYWADEIVVMDTHQESLVRSRLNSAATAFGDESLKNKPVHNFKIPDKYPYRDPELMKLIHDKAKEIWMAD